MIQKLEGELKTLENTIDGDYILQRKKKELETNRTKIIIGSRVQWIRGRKKVTKHFCSSEKRRFTSKRLSVLINSSYIMK